MSCNIKIGSKDSFLKVQIIGNATWNNAKYFFDFIEEHVKAGCHKVLLDLMDCSYFDSTYFGVIVELVELVEAQEDGAIHMVNVSDDLMREMKTIGLDKVITLADKSIIEQYKDITTTESPFQERYSKLQKAKQILKAHQVLEKLSENNKQEFGSVVKYFKDYIENRPEDEP